MNTITYKGESYPFNTPVELLAIPFVREFPDDPSCNYLGQGDGCLVAYKLIEGTPVMCVVGRLDKPVVLPKEIRGEQSQGVKS